MRLDVGLPGGQPVLRLVHTQWLKSVAEPGAQCALGIKKNLHKRGIVRIRTVLERKCALDAIGLACLFALVYNLMVRSALRSRGPPACLWIHASR
jgi:hypothetical protein